PHCGAFINRSPFVLMASFDADGRVDVSPKGDPAGFVKILDDKTLAIPDRPGNRLADTLENLLQRPRIGLIFLMPGKAETLRVNGSAKIVADPALLESMAVKGKPAQLATVVSVEEAYFHCSKCMIRSGLWEPERWPSLDGAPSMAEALIAAMGLPLTSDQMHELLEKDAVERLF
ncbi:MAG: MSMEG_1061 family FMN-dependent PPOX-type flavoprotein, partial [Pseudomonadota bacterium]